MNAHTDKGFPFKITVESGGKPGQEISGEWPEQKVPASALIEHARKEGLPVEGPSESLTLKGKSGTYSGDKMIDLSQDNDFTIEQKEARGPYKFTVNGRGLESERQKPTAQEIIDMAQAAGVSIPAEPKLEARGGHKFESDDPVDLEQFHEFIILPGGPTPVA